MPQIILQRLAQLIHQRGDLVLARAALQRVGKLLLDFAQAPLGVGQIALLDAQRRAPQQIDHAGRLRRHAVLRNGVAKAAQRGAQAQIGGVILEYVVGIGADRLQHVAHTRRGLGAPRQIAALFDDRARQRVDEAAARQRETRLGAPFLPGAVLDDQRQDHRQPRPRVFGEILDHRLRRALSRAAQRQRQGELDRLEHARRRQTARPGRVRVERDGGARGGHAIVVRRFKAELQRAGARAGGRFGERHQRAFIRDRIESPAAESRDLERAGARQRHGHAPGAAALILKRRRIRRRAAQRGRLRRVEHPQRDFGADRQDDRFRRLDALGQVERRDAGVQRRRGPCLNAGSGRLRHRRRRARHRNQRLGQPRAAVAKLRHHPRRQRQRGGVAQREAVAVGDAQIRRGRPRRHRARGHARLMRGPDAAGGGVARPRRQRILQRRDRLIRRAAIQKRQRLGPGGAAPAAPRAARQPQRASAKST